jgi:hypothetical protein
MVNLTDTQPTGCGINDCGVVGLKKAPLPYLRRNYLIWPFSVGTANDPPEDAAM